METKLKLALSGLGLLTIGAIVAFAIALVEQPKGELPVFLSLAAVFLFFIFILSWRNLK